MVVSDGGVFKCIVILYQLVFDIKASFHASFKLEVKQKV